MHSPCDQCPFSKANAKAYGRRRLEGYARGEFPCHKSATLVEDEDGGSGEYRATDESVHCAGALIYLEKRNRPHQMMRICERLGVYDRTKLDMAADVA
jgi:hypothetical protein